jgi:biopolymer transport protein ExbD
MQRRLRERLDTDSGHGIDLSPLIDVVFILLIFFIVTTVFIKETGVEVDKPQAVSSEQLENQLILIAITRSGEIVYDHSNIGLAGVRPTVAALLSIQDRPVVLQVDREVATDLLVKVMDEAKLAGAKSLNIATSAVDR